MEMILPEKYDPAFYHFMMTSVTKIIDLAREKNVLALVHGAFNKKRVNTYRCILILMLLNQNYYGV